MIETSLTMRCDCEEEGCNAYLTIEPLKADPTRRCAVITVCMDAGLGVILSPAKARQLAAELVALAGGDA